MLELSRREARRIAVKAQLLDDYRPASLVEVVDQLMVLQVDPTAAVAPSADLVAFSRLGVEYQPHDLTFALEAERSLVEHSSFVRPMADIGAVLALRDEAIHHTARSWVESNDRFRADVLARLRSDGPCRADTIQDTCQVPWRSTGWTDEKNVLRMLDERRLDSLGVARGRGTNEMLTVADAGEPCRIEGLDDDWRVSPAVLATMEEEFRPRTALLSPYDRLVKDRHHALALFDFEYVLEMYKPAARRRWGYFALPILHGDHLVGKLDAKADRKAGVLRVYTVHEDVPFTAGIADAVDAEIEALAGWLGLEVAR